MSPLPPFDPPKNGQARRQVWAREAGEAPALLREGSDAVAREEALEIRLLSRDTRGEPRSLSLGIVMRSPGQDRELAVGLALSEGLIRGREHLAGLEACAAGAEGEAPRLHLHLAEGAPGTELDPESLMRRQAIQAACGLCGRAELPLPVSAGNRQPVAVDGELLRRIQAWNPPEGGQAHAACGGLHSARLHDEKGRLLCLREDVGRHNAVDKALGARLLEGENLPGARVLWVSGRASYELVWKAAAAGIPCLAAVGAPSTAAVELAGACGLLLVGFLREGGFNVYRPAGGKD